MSSNDCCRSCVALADTARAVIRSNQLQHQASSAGIRWMHRPSLGLHPCKSTERVYKPIAAMIFLTVVEPLKEPPSYTEGPCCGIPIGRKDSQRQTRLAAKGEILAVKPDWCKGRRNTTGKSGGRWKGRR